MAFQGSLKELPLPDIIHLIAVSGRSGVFSVEDDRVAGKIYLHEGQIVHAEVGAIKGDEAVYELSIWPDGEFKFEPGEFALPMATIDKPNTSLLMEAARRIDEWTILAKRIPSTRMVPVLTSAGDRGMSFDPQEWRVVKKVDERRSLEGIALALDESPFEIAKIAFGLVSSKVIELREHAPFIEPDRLSRLSQDQVEALTSKVYQQASAKLTGNDSLTRLATLHAPVQGLNEHPGHVAALIDLVRGAQHLVAADLGPEKASDFYDRVEELITEL